MIIRCMYHLFHQDWKFIYKTNLSLRLLVRGNQRTNMRLNISISQRMNFTFYSVGCCCCLLKSLQSSVESKDSENLLSKKILTMKNLDNLIMLGINLLLFFLQSAETAAESPTDDQLRPNKSEKHFVLVHGACHGAWSWYKVVAMLRSSGHNVTALDLGASGINPLQALQIPHQSDYFRPLMLFLPLRESYSWLTVSVVSPFLKQWKPSHKRFLLQFLSQPSCLAHPSTFPPSLHRYVW